MIEVVKLPKKFRQCCYDIMDGKDEALETLTSFVKFPHQIMAVQAEIAYFNLDYDTAINLDIQLLPFWDEWHYSNCAKEHIMAMTFAAKKTDRTPQVTAALKKAQEEIAANDDNAVNGKNQRYNFCGLMLKYIETGDYWANKELCYKNPENPKTMEMLKEEILSKDKKIDFSSVKGKEKLCNFCRLYGTAEDYLKVYKEIQNENLSEMWHEEAICRYLYMNKTEEAFNVVKILAETRMWAVAAATQVRPMNFFLHPSMHGFLTDEKYLSQIRTAAATDTGNLIRK